MVPVIALTFNSLSLLNPVWNTWCVIFKQYFMKFWDKGFTLETKHWWWLYISEKIKFPMDLHIKAYHLNHWLLSLYGFKYLHYSVTLSSRGWNPFPGVCSDLDIKQYVNDKPTRALILNIYVILFIYVLKNKKKLLERNLLNCWTFHKS